MILSNLGILFRITWMFKKSFAAENSSFDVKKKNMNKILLKVEFKKIRNLKNENCELE